MLKFGASLSLPQREQMTESLNLSRSSPFGPLSEISSRRTFAYLIATLNASHPDYDFSHILRPADFRRERSLRKVMANLDSTLNSVRPNAKTPVNYATSAFPPSNNSGLGSSPPAVSGTESPPWGPHMWGLINKEMTLNQCTVYSYQPDVDPFDDEAAAIWSLHYFFFNKALKRVAYICVRGVPVISYNSPVLHPRRSAMGSSSGDLKRQAGLTEDSGASKRARYWLGDRPAVRITSSDDEDDYVDDGWAWNRDRDGEVEEFTGNYDESDDHGFEESSDEEYYDDDQEAKGPVRGVSEDIASRMEIEL